jgi:ribose-phosphate pyrophosphokinase
MSIKGGEIMPRITAQEVQTIPYGPLGIIPLQGCEELATKIDNYIVRWRDEQAADHKNSIAF